MGHLDQTGLARRWRLSPRTLEAWRWRRQGPPHLKIGGRILYRIEDIETFEAASRRTNANLALSSSQLGSAQ